MKIILLLLLLCAPLFAQERTDDDSWLVDKSVVQKKVHAVGVGRSKYQAFACAMSNLKEKIEAGSKEEPRMSTSLSYSFGGVEVTALRKKFEEEQKSSDTVISEETNAIKIYYSNNGKSCLIKSYIEYSDTTESKQSSSNSYSSVKTSGEQSLSYTFKEMNFDDLLMLLVKEGIECKFHTEFDVVYALVTYPISKIKK